MPSLSQKQNSSSIICKASAFEFSHLGSELPHYRITSEILPLAEQGAKHMSPSDSIQTAIG